MASAKSAAAPSLWNDVRDTCSILNLGVIVVQVLGRRDTEWVVTSSHGEPKGEFPTRESAKKYAEKFAANMVEKTLAGLSELESHMDGATNGWGPKPCVLVVLKIDPSDDHIGDDGLPHPEIFEQKRARLIDDTRGMLRKILADLNR